MGTTGESYKAREFNLSGLNGISDQTLEMHFGLYQGYVKNTNLLNEKVAGLIESGSVKEPDMVVFSELKRRYGFEYNGMVLHEYYFENMKRQGGGEPDKSSGFYQAAEKSFGGYEKWKNDFSSVGKMRGIGWAICFQDPSNGLVSNHWVAEHEQGNVAGFTPALVMDVWEHAYLLDYKPSERGKYIESFFSNIDWDAVSGRLGRK
ncbi:MAG: superoxide dismutase [Acidobacteriota bacterium]